MTQHEIIFAGEPDLEAEEFIDVLVRSTLAERRPVNDGPRIEAMLRNATVIVSARNTDGLLVGVARAISDFAYCTYLSDIAVDVAYQRLGIGKELMARTHREAGLSTTLILLSAPTARSYYPHVGLEPHSSCWTIAARE